jgi:hypothetical protein
MDTTTAHRAPLIVDQPQEGYYRTRLVRGGPLVPVRIWFGPPNDPVTGEPLDRSPRWQALVNGREHDAAAIWNWCAGNPITGAEYDYMLRVKDWAERHAPHEPEANPYQSVNPRAAAPVGPPRRG